MQEHIFNRIKANSPAAKDSLEAKLKEQFQRGPNETDYPHAELTTEEKEILSLIDRETNVLAEHYGGTPKLLGPEHVHLLLDIPKHMSFVENNAIFSVDTQRILLDHAYAGRTRSGFTSATFHEAIHYKSLLSIQQTKTGDIYPDRIGYSVNRMTESGTTQSVFDHINEGITEELTVRFLLKNYDHPLLSDESKDEIIEDAARQKEREILKILVREIWKKNRESFNNRVEVFDSFAHGAFSGNILPSLQLVQRSLGEEVYKTLAIPETDEFQTDRVLAFLKQRYA